MSNLIEAFIKQTRTEATVQSCKSDNETMHNSTAYILGYVESSFTMTLLGLDLSEKQMLFLADRMTRSILNN